MTHRVLVTAVGGNIGQGVVKALRAGSRHYVITGADMEPRSAGFAFVDQPCVTPSATDAALFGVLVDTVRAQQIEAIFVCSPAELAFFSEAQARLEAETGVTVLLNPPQAIAIAQDKLDTARFLEAHGFASPESAPAEDDAAVDRLIDRWGFPVILKPRRGWTSTNVFRVDSRSAIAALRTVVPNLIVQRYLPDERSEYTAGVVGSAADGAFAWINLRRDLVQGTTYRTELAQDQRIGAAMVAIAQALGVEGSCNFQFRVVDGTPFVFEINPRFSGTSGIRYLYGFNDPEMAFEQRRLKIAVRQPVVRPGVVLRYWNEVHVAGADFAAIAAQPAHAGRQIILPTPHDAS